MLEVNRRVLETLEPRRLGDVDEAGEIAAGSPSMRVRR
jgi:hypothetical protein